jgi:UDP-N-acetylglucosamine--N-acetylmuramyl-(pentapeptide) pyrophosphoryl-undecaprenol N-acetylglucosamine transferase
MTVRVLLAGGGSGGSSTPVIAVAQELARRRDCRFLYVGTDTGPERQLVAMLGIPFRTVQTGKLRRYLSVQNFVDLFRLPVGFLQSLGIVRSFRPHVAFAAGGFAAVPPLLAAGLLGVPTVIHQQDVEPGLANRILAPFASVITVTFGSSVPHFPRHKTRVTGNPARAEILSGSRERAMQCFAFQPDRPVLLATGGGTGALGLNRLMAQAAALLPATYQIIHITGTGKAVPAPDAAPGYRQVEFLVEEMGDVLAAADLIVSRAGLSALTELSVLGKPSILIPMPDSHQNANARVFGDKGAALVLQERETTPHHLAKLAREMASNRERLDAMGRMARELMMPSAETRIADELERVIGRQV